VEFDMDTQKKDTKNIQFENDDFEKKTETFDSAFYFDDIIKELSEAGFYTDEEKDEKPLEGTESIASNNLQLDGLKKDLNKQIEDVKVSFKSEISTISDKFTSLRELLTKQKHDMNGALKELQNSMMLHKNDSEEHTNKLMDMFSTKIGNDQIKDKAFEKLYDQMSSYKHNFIKSAMKPFVSDLMLYYDRIQSHITHYLEENKGDFISELTMFKDELLEIFNRNGITLMDKSEIGSRFSPEKSNAVQKIDTNNPELDFTIKEIVQEGYMQENMVLRPESVVIYKFAKSKD